MKIFSTAVLSAALALAAGGCATVPESYDRAVKEAEWYDALHADRRRCESAGGTIIVEKLWASRLVREIRPGSRYTCHMRDQHGPAWNWIP